MEHCPTAKISKFHFPYFYVHWKEATKYTTKLDKEILQSKTLQVQDYKDGSELQFIKFDFVTGGQEIKIAIPVQFWLC